jgi:hypothetical protein
MGHDLPNALLPDLVTEIARHCARAEQSAIGAKLQRKGGGVP